MPAFDDDIPQAEKRRVVLQDADVRNTYLGHTHPEAGGRFALTERHTITGVASPAPPPLPASSPWHGSDPVPTEPPLGYRIDAMPGEEPSASPLVAEATGALVPETPSSDKPQPPAGDVEAGTGAPPSSEPMAARRKSQMSSSSGQFDDVGAGRPPARWRK